MNPYEAPQTSLEPEKRPRVPVKDEQYDTRTFVKIVVVILLVLCETVLSILLLQRLAYTFSFHSNSHILHFDAMLPWAVGIFLVIAWLLFRMRKAVK